MAEPIAKLIAWALSLKAVRAFLRYSERNGPAHADSVTYRTLFSLFAGVLLVFSVAALYLRNNPDAWAVLIGAVNSAIPGLIGDEGVITLDAIDTPAGFTIAGVVSLVGLLGAAAGAIASLKISIRSLADTGPDSGFFLLTLVRNIVLAVVVGALLLTSAGVTLLATAGIGLVADWLGLSSADGLSAAATWAASVVVIYALDVVVIALLFRSLSGLRPRAGTLWRGAMIGAIGLIVLQQLSGLFVGGATANPLLAAFASLIALLLWLNLSAQVILIASAYIVTGVEDDGDRVRARHGARTFAQRRRQRAEDGLRLAAKELDAARDAERAERERG